MVVAVEEVVPSVAVIVDIPVVVVAAGP